MTTPSGFLFRPLVRSLAFGLLLAAGLASAQPASIVEDDEIEVSDELSAEGLPALPEKPSKTLRFGYFESAPTRMRERLLEPTVEALMRLFAPPHSASRAARPGRGRDSICSRPRRTI